jgi:hypothetical protein
VVQLERAIKQLSHETRSRMPAKRGAASVSLDASPSKTKVARVNADAEDLARAAGSGKADPSCTVSGTLCYLFERTDVFYFVRM